jgi:hypothetical protein
MRKVYLIGLVTLVGFTLLVPGLARPPRWEAEAQAKTEAIWEVPAFIQLLVDKEAFIFPELEPGIDEYLAEDAVTLTIFSNTDWALSFALEGDPEAVAHFRVLLPVEEGFGNARISVDYLLVGLREMPPGTYQVTVVYTATTR